MLGATGYPVGIEGRNRRDCRTNELGRWFRPVLPQLWINGGLVAIGDDARRCRLPIRAELADQVRLWTARPLTVSPSILSAATTVGRDFMCTMKFLSGGGMAILCCGAHLSITNRYASATVAFSPKRQSFKTSAGDARIAGRVPWILVA